jgi:translation initiation factor 2 alpha subunit (eIF-2alpha)
VPVIIALCVHLCVCCRNVAVASASSVMVMGRMTASRQVQSIMGQMSLKLGVPIEDLCRRISWPLYRKFGHAYDGFRLAESCVVAA